MHFYIDLNASAIRESEKVEWKEKGDDKNIVQSIVKTIAAFANDLSNFGGDYVVCGAKEGKDKYGFPKDSHDFSYHARRRLPRPHF